MKVVTLYFIILILLLILFVCLITIFYILDSLFAAIKNKDKESILDILTKLLYNIYIYITDIYIVF